MAARFRQSRSGTFALCNRSPSIKFKRTCAAKYPPKRGSRSKPPSLPASGYGSRPQYERLGKHRARPSEARAVDAAHPSAKHRKAPALRCNRPDAISCTHDAGACGTARSAWPASQTTSCRTSNQWNRPKFSTARATWSDSIRLRGATTESKTCRPTGSAKSTYSPITPRCRWQSVRLATIDSG